MSWWKLPIGYPSGNPSRLNFIGRDVGPQIHMRDYVYPIINYSQEEQKYVNKFSLEWKLFLINFYNLLYAFCCLKSINIIMNGSHLIKDPESG